MTAPAICLNPPFRAEHIGSLKRPEILLRTRKAYSEGRCTLSTLRAAEDAAIQTAIQMQRDVGIKGITDGEFRRTNVNGKNAGIYSSRAYSTN